jgi:hypothetical protein
MASVADRWHTNWYVNTSWQRFVCKDVQRSASPAFYF